LGVGPKGVVERGLADAAWKGEIFPMTHVVTLGDRGRLVLPAQVRRELNLEAGTPMVVRVHPDGSIHLRPFRTAAEQGLGLANRLGKPRKGAAVKALADARRREVEREG